MIKTYEIAGKFEHEANAASLLYAPPAKPLTFRKTMRYIFDYEGDESALDAFVSKVLVDAISQEEHHDGTPLWPNANLILDYGMKGGALDLEKEAILSYYRTLSQPAFTLKKLTLKTRLYVFGQGAEPSIFVRDIVNPAIHTHEVLKAA
ncbi:hypothetical protein DES53_101862 [Roseimicrobium gellanilyticum]|uniref:Uncharacterized protein n=1 Tax=Roseimicrobium gellanilyticum TaxID=748857 RepID=A0A366HUW4_9BACT|nr:hypothetical protein [Roseimicrobium gellanilyticum]RBP48062.1 hypothetical protein DES53_101862 [Roseimicrobium gellanilyticum]